MAGYTYDPPPPPSPGPREPERTLTCEVLGYRQWKVNEDMRLASAIADTVWEPGVNEARCESLGPAFLQPRRPGPPVHDAPHHDCHCGFYALHEPSFWYAQEDDDLTRGHLASRPGEQGVCGLVAGWGRVEVHHEGFRSQFARVVAIAAPKNKRGAVLARAVADEYGVPCVPRGELERVASEFGESVPVDVRPGKPKDPFADAGVQGFVYGGGGSSHYGGGSGGVYFTAATPPGFLSYMPWWWFMLVGVAALCWLASVGLVIIT